MLMTGAVRETVTLAGRAERARVARALPRDVAARYPQRVVGKSPALVASPAEGVLRAQ